jgi:hypothetical protein
LESARCGRAREFHQAAWSNSVKYLPDRPVVTGKPRRRDSSGAQHRAAGKRHVSRTVHSAVFRSIPQREVVAACTPAAAIALKFPQHPARVLPIALHDNIGRDLELDRIPAEILGAGFRLYQQARSVSIIHLRIHKAPPQLARRARHGALLLYLARRRSRDCRVGATHHPHTVCGGLHLPYKWLTSARVWYGPPYQRSMTWSGPWNAEASSRASLANPGPSGCSCRETICWNWNEARRLMSPSFRDSSPNTTPERGRTQEFE